MTLMPGDRIACWKCGAHVYEVVNRVDPGTVVCVADIRSCNGPQPRNGDLARCWCCASGMPLGRWIIVARTQAAPTLRCECGAEACGFTSHSHWCAKAKEAA